MALFIDGADYYNTTGSLQLVWDATSSAGGYTAVGSGVFGYGRAIQMNNSFCAKTLSAVPGGGAGQWPTIYACWHIIMPNNGVLGDDTNQHFAVLDGATNQVNLRMTNAGIWKVYRNATLLGTGATAMALGQTYFIAVKVTINNGAGVFRMDIVGPGVNVTEFNISGANTQNTANAYGTLVRFSRIGAANTDTFLDNVHIYDGSDGAPWNAISGERRVYFNLPTGDGALTQWTPSAGARYQCVDENPPNSDTDYISEATATDRNTFTVAALSGISVDAVKLSMFSRRDDAGPRGIKLSARIGGVNYDSAEFLQGASYAYWGNYWILSPATAGNWGLAEMNGTEWGVLLST